MKKNTLKKKYKRIVHVLVCAAILICCVKFVGYYRAAELCGQIRSGKEIHTNFSNGTTGPRFLLRVGEILQYPEPTVNIPLVVACYYRNVQAVETLLENGADPNFFFDGYWSPLEAAVARGSVSEESCEIIEQLMQAGADPLQYASSEAIMETLSTRIWYGSLSQWEEKAIFILLDNGADYITPNRDSILVAAAHGNHFALVDRLITDYDCDLDAITFQGQTALSLILCRKGAEAREMAEYLLSYGANPDLPDEHGKTARDYAREAGCEDIFADE